YKWSPRQTFADLFSKTWMEPSIPFMVMVLLAVFFTLALPGFASPYSIQILGHGYAEVGFIALAMGLSLMSGGIDLSVGSMYAVLNFVALGAITVLGLPFPLVLMIVVIAGALL